MEADDDELFPDVVQPTQRTRGWLSTYWHEGREVGLSYPFDGERHFGFFLSSDTTIVSGNAFAHIHGDMSVNDAELAQMLLLFRNAAAKRIIVSDFCHALEWVREDDYLATHWAKPQWLDDAWRTDPIHLACAKALYRLGNLRTSFNRYLIGLHPLHSTARDTVAVRSKLLGYPVYDLTQDLIDQIEPVD